MYELYDNHWRYFNSSTTMKLCVIFSIFLHSFVGYSLLLSVNPSKPKPKAVSVQVSITSPTVPDSEIKQVDNAPPPPPPPPPPPDEDKLKEEKAKADKAKSDKLKEEKAKADKAKADKAKADKAKADKAKADKAKADKAKADKLEKERLEKERLEKEKEPPPEVVAKAQPIEGVQKKTLPDVLTTWAGLVQRKVHSKWRMPGGVKVIEENKEVHISFWVDRNGKILGTPEVVKAADDPALAKAGLLAIKLAEPLPKLPNEFMGTEQQILYVFTLKE